MPLQLSTCDILSEAKYAEKIRASKEHGAAILTYVWFGMQVGSLIGILLSGIVIENVSAKLPYLIASVPAICVLIPVGAGFIEEQKKSSEEVSLARAQFAQQKEVCLLCVLIFLATVALTVCALVSSSPELNCLVAVTIFVVMMVAFSLVLSPIIAKFNAFSLLQTSLSLSTSGAGFYFYTDTEEQYPEGPHFSQFFYVSVIGVIGTVFSLVGIIAYQRYMSTWKYRHLMLIANIAYAGLSLLDLVMYLRVNKRIGIPDHAFVLSSTVLSETVRQWMWMPQVVILSYLCPKGMEATMYALLAGCHNLGGSLASNCGALLLHRLGCRPNGAVNESHAFDNLWVASLVSTLLPLGSIALLFHLVPDARQDEALLDDESQADATAGSLWRRWRAAQAGG